MSASILCRLASEDRTLGRISDITAFHNEAAIKLDYFLLGATLAICGYLAQTNPYGQIGLNEETFLLATLLVFVASAMAGFKCIETNISLLRKNADALEIPDLAVRHHYLSQLRSDRTAHNYYTAKKYLLVAGLVCYVATKVWVCY